MLINDAGNTHPLTLNGSGTLTLQAGSVIQGASGHEVLVNSSTIQGVGTISNLGVDNYGTITAGSGGSLVLKPTSSFGLLNLDEGTLQAMAGGELVLNATASPNGIANLAKIGVEDGGTMEVIGAAGATVDLGNVIDLDAGGGGGVIDVGGSGAGGKLVFSGSHTTFDLNNAESSINGGPAPGTLALSDNPKNLITGVTGTETLINDVGETLSGAGTIEDLALVNNGTIIANDTNPLNINTVATGSNTGFINSGTIEVESGSTLKTTLANGASGIGLANSGTITVVKGDTFFVALGIPPQAQPCPTRAR